ncbi:hypothetical protein FACS1894127_3740 [Clostridia bacterium]|nr:hypothetical protein FACS1894127_3740 [Clostridia bacterium]
MSESKAVDRFYDYLQSILAIYRDMIPVLMNEIEYIKSEDISGLDGALKLQQAMLLRTKNFDVRVMAYLKELGISADNLSLTVQQLPEEERFRFYSFLGEFDQVMEQVSFYKGKCRELLHTRLYQMDKQAVNSGLSDGLTYDEYAGGNKPSYSKVFEKKI